MKKILLLLLWMNMTVLIQAKEYRKDWLLDGSTFRSKIEVRDSIIYVENGLMSRVFTLPPYVATVGLDNKMTGNGELRAVRPEALLIIDGKEYPVGGLYGQPVQNFLSRNFISGMKGCDTAFVCTGYEIGKTVERFPYKPNRKWIANDENPWPAPGKRIVFEYQAGPEASQAIRGITVRVIYEIYDGAPIMSKQIEVDNGTDRNVTLNAFKSEILALAETAPKVHYGEPHEIRMLAQDPGTFTRNYRKKPVQTDAPRDYIDRFTQLFVVTDYAMGGDMEAMKDNPAVRWVFDHPEYEATGIRYYGQYKPARLEVGLPIGPELDIAPGEKFQSCTAFEMLRDATDTERRGLAERRFWRIMAPWTQENPIFMHVRSSDEQSVRTAIDQCAEVGFEMVIMTFGSGFNIEDDSPEYLARMKRLNDYAVSKGITLGGYSLLASRGAGNEDAAISRKTGKPAVSREEGSRFGKSPCLASEWGNRYFNRLTAFFEKTGMGNFEHDGSYPGDVCASTLHTHHKGLQDSQWNQFHKITELYHWMREKGIYLNVPDFYFLNGSTKTSIGYRETNWSLPRDRQLIHTRQLNYDCTWERIPSSLWSFVPLVEYHGGGAAATLEPLSEHLFEYKMLMVQNYGAGIQACYRGPRLYDTPETKAVVTDIIRWYKKYRNILNSDIIHLRKPDAQDWDGIMHVNPQGKEKGFALFFNPTDEAITRKIDLPLYYTGLTETARIREQEGSSVEYRLGRDYSVQVEVTIPANGYTWYVIE